MPQSRRAGKPIRKALFPPRPGSKGVSGGFAGPLARGGLEDEVLNARAFRMNKVPAHGPGENRKGAERQRLAAALRANLGRRKAQGRGRQAAEAGSEQQDRAGDEGEAISEAISRESVCHSEGGGDCPGTTS
ncbi:hypothetical protein CR492_04865 [Methylocella silvestris]|uniref:Uncharacterized protein n=1 Tax=Methylocella silvestris TaxID=199596 RepID=A0A2J7TJT6_METSI|nr:hypothetical protein CR492_04865 [Methylocella silvestris]